MSQSSGRLLQSVELQQELEEANKRQAVVAASKAYLSRLFELNVDAPVRYDPPVHQPRHQTEPKYFHSGNGKNNSRVTHTRKQYRMFGTR